jgi:non-specific serine/threonine protein kinase/serine/threonine-protein kinase
MSADRWTEVCRLFDAAREMPGEERVSFLARECGGDADLQAEVTSLLAKDDGGSFLDDPAAPGLPPRRRVGPYELVREIDRGGMGVVYEAVRQDQGFERAVAVKLVKRGMDTDFILRRFEGERRILADLDHPNVARVLDGGSTDDGLPFFVMELIRGKHLLDYCEEKKLDTARKLALFRQVCSAVTYAHQRLVIHRDIKPANILVTEDGVPKLLDFGIAKVLAGDRDAPESRTETALRVLTPEYASPEQVLGKEITTSSDVYSLGVVLYELLTGQRPYRLAGRAPEEVASAVVSQEPEKPSTRARLHRDLDHIVMMALRKEPERRYASAEQLSEDIRRHLEGLPVRATPDSVGYRAGKFIRRHKAGVAAFTLAAVFLVGGLALALWQMQVARRERSRAEEHLSEVRKLATSFLFEHHDAIKDLAGSTPARKLLVERGVTYLDRLSREAGGDLEFQRELALAYERLGNLQAGLGNEGTLGSTQGALESLRKSLRLRETLAARKPADPKDRNALAQALIGTGNLANKRGAKAESLADFRRSAAIREALVAENPADAGLKNDLGVSYHFVATGLYESGDRRGSVEARRREAALFSEVAAAKPGDRKARRNLALAYQYLGSLLTSSGSEALATEDLPGGLEALQKARPIQEALCAEDAGNATYKKDLSSTYVELGHVLGKMERNEQAAENFRSALAIREALAAADPNDITVRTLLSGAQMRLGKYLSLVGRHEEAIDHGRKALARTEGVAAADPKNVYYKADVAQALWYMGFSLCRSASVASPAAERASAAREGRGALLRSRDIYTALKGAGHLPAVHDEYLNEAVQLLPRCGEDPRAD